MKRFLKILGVLLLLLLAAIILIPILFKDEIIDRAKSEASQQLEARVDFGDIDISLFRSFPNFSLGIEQFTVEGTGRFEGTQLASIGNFTLELNLFSVMAGSTFEVEAIRISNADIHLLVDAEGNANYLITKTSEADAPVQADTTSSGFTLRLKEWAFDNVNLVYEDKQGALKARVREFNQSGSGDFTEEIVNVITQTEVGELSVGMGGIDYLYKTKAFADVELVYDQPEATLTLKENTFGLNNVRLKMDGSIAMPDEGMALDLSFEAPQNEFKSVLSLIPAVFLEGFERVKTTGTFALSGKVKGKYDAASEVYPSFEVDLFVRNASFRYPDLPAGVNDIHIEAHIKNPSNELNATIIDIPMAEAMVANSPFKARMLLKTPISDPQFDVAVNTDMQLESLGEVVPASGFDYKGRVKGNIAMAGRMSDINAERYEAVQVNGKLEAAGVVLKNDSLSFPIKVDKAEMDFTPQQVNLTALQMELGNSDFAANGSVDNLLNYLLEDSVLQADFTLESQLIDLNQLFAAVPQGGEAEKAENEPASPMEAIRLPKNVDFVLISTVQKVLYDDLEINDLEGVVELNRGVAELRDLEMHMLNGRVAMNGSYNSVPPSPVADVDFKISNFGFKEAVQHFVSFQKLAPIMESATGSFSTGFTFSSKLNPDMTPDLSTILAKGALQTQGLTVSPKSLNKLANNLKNQSLATLDLGKVNLSFAVENGRVQVEPFQTSAGSLSATVQGSNGLDQSLDYTMDMNIPASGIGANELLSSIGVARGGKVAVKVLIGGTVSDPEVRTSLGDLVGDAFNNLKDQAEAKVEEVKQEAIDQVNEEAQKLIDAAEAKGDQLIAEAEKQAANIRATAKAQADKLRREAENQATKLEEEAKGNILKEQGARLAAKKLREEADEKARLLEAEAEKRANALVDKAREEKQKLVEEAREKGKISG